MSEIETSSLAETLRIGPMLSAIMHFPGRVLFSGSDTIRPGDLYVMGMNPGGSFTPNPPLNETIGFTLAEARKGWSYLEEEPETPQAALLHARVSRVFQDLGREPSETLITNAVFVRAKDRKAFGRAGLNFWQLWWNLCWPVHQVLLGVVKPKLVVCFGKESYEAIRNPRPPERGRYHERPDIRPDAGDQSRPDRWVLNLGPGGQLETAVLQLPHPSARNAAEWPGGRLGRKDQIRLEKAKELLSS